MRKKNNCEEDANQRDKVTKLEESNRNLQEKLKLLRIQLMSQSQLHLASISHPRSISLNRSSINLHSSRHFHSTNGLKMEEKNIISPRKHSESILHQIRALQDELDDVKEQHKTHIAKLEKQIAESQNSISPTRLKQELNENIELIKLKRLSKKQSAQILSLQSQLELSNTELKQLQDNLSTITNDKDVLQTELSNEKCENAKLSADISMLKENIKFLEDQINDLQKEKNTLKEHNENLLQLSLQQKPATFDSSKPNCLNQLKELQENLQKEIFTKSELTSKLADAELSIVKYKNELMKNNSLISDLQATNQSIENEVKRLKSIIKNDKIHVKGEKLTISTEDKSVMAVPLDDNSTINENDLNFVSNLDSRDDSAIKIRLYSVTQELDQCKELLRVQYGINNKYKKEVEELQKIFQSNQKLSQDNLHNFQNILFNHEKHLSKINDISLNENFKPIFHELNNIFSLNKLSNEDCINCIEKLLNIYILLIERFNKILHHSNLKEKDTNLDKSIHNLQKILQTQVNNEHVATINDDKSAIVSHSKFIKGEQNIEKSVVFELYIEKACFNFFSDHLMKSSENNPKIFLTWNFLNDNEHQAFTPTISVKEGIFDCSCQYEGPWSEFLINYLKQHGILIEIHLVQNDISVRLAETKIDTASALEHQNKFQKFISEFENDNIRGNVTGMFILRGNMAEGKT